MDRVASQAAKGRGIRDAMLALWKSGIQYLVLLCGFMMIIENPACCFFSSSDWFPFASVCLLFASVCLLLSMMII